jgi:hypothetical protein
VKKKNPYQRRPTAAAVARFARKTDRENPKFTADYTGVRAVFLAFFRNRDENSVYIKVQMVNTIFNTQIKDPHGLARRLTTAVKGLDRRLKQGDETLIEEVGRYIAKSGQPFRFYSFATKFCHCHNPRAFPIYDSAKADSLYAFNRHQPFSKFTKKAIHEDYSLFKRVLQDFIDHFQLNSLKKNEVDRFLWKLGLDARRERERVKKIRENRQARQSIKSKNAKKFR